MGVMQMGKGGTFRSSSEAKISSENKVARKKINGEKKASKRRAELAEQEKKLEEDLKKLMNIDENGRDISPTIPRRRKMLGSIPSSDDENSSEDESGGRRSLKNKMRKDFFEKDRKELKALLNVVKQKPGQAKRRCFLCNGKDPGQDGWRRSDEMGVIFCTGCAQTAALQGALAGAARRFNRGYRDGDYTAARLRTRGGPGDFALVPAADERGRRRGDRAPHGGHAGAPLLPAVRTVGGEGRRGRRRHGGGGGGGAEGPDSPLWWQHKKRAKDQKLRDKEVQNLAAQISESNSAMTNYRDKNYYHSPIVPEGKMKGGGKAHNKKKGRRKHQHLPRI